MADGCMPRVARGAFSAALKLREFARLSARTSDLQYLILKVASFQV